MKTASYFPWPSKKWAVLVIENIADGKREKIEEIFIPTDKRKARKIAAELNATPWNF